MHTRRPPHEDEDRVWGDASTSPRMSTTSSKPPEVKRDMEPFFLMALRRNQLSLYLDLGFPGSKTTR